jgi:hypothetical protein
MRCGNHRDGVNERKADELVTSLIEYKTDTDHGFTRAFRAYLRAVAASLGIGLESTTVDVDTPVSAYLALDWRLRRFADRDLALLWDERHGWSAAVETHSGEDMIVLAYLGGDTVCPDPRRVVQFLAALRADDRTLGRPVPPALREPGNHGELRAELAPYLASTCTGPR